jgi:hypothetical protein
LSFLGDGLAALESASAKILVHDGRRQRDSTYGLGIGEIDGIDWVDGIVVWKIWLSIALKKYGSPFGKGSIVDVMASKMLIHGCECGGFV